MKAYIIIDEEGLFFDIKATFKQAVECLISEISFDPFWVIRNPENPTSAEVLDKEDPTQKPKFYIDLKEF